MSSNIFEIISNEETPTITVSTAECSKETEDRKGFKVVKVSFIVAL